MLECQSVKMRRFLYALVSLTKGEEQCVVPFLCLTYSLLDRIADRKAMIDDFRHRETKNLQSERENRLAKGENSTK